MPHAPDKRHSLAAWCAAPDRGTEPPRRRGAMLPYSPSSMAQQLGTVRRVAFGAYPRRFERGQQVERAKSDKSPTAEANPQIEVYAPHVKVSSAFAGNVHTRSKPTVYSMHARARRDRTRTAPALEHRIGTRTANAQR